MRVVVWGRWYFVLSESLYNAVVDIIVVVVVNYFRRTGVGWEEEAMVSVGGEDVTIPRDWTSIA